MSGKQPMTGAQTVTSLVLGVVGVILVLLAVNSMMPERGTQLGGDDNGSDGRPGPPADDHRVVVLQAVIGLTDELGFIADDRDVDITVWLDGAEIELTGERSENGGIWYDVYVLPVGTHVRFRVVQEDPGFLQCTITVNAVMLSPGAYHHRYGPGDCDVEETVR